MPELFSNMNINYNFSKRSSILLLFWFNALLPIVPHIPFQDTRYEEMKLFPLGMTMLIPAYVFGTGHVFMCAVGAFYGKFSEIKNSKKELLNESIKTGNIEEFKKNISFFLDFYIIDQSRFLIKQINENCNDQEKRDQLIDFVNQQKLLATNSFNNSKKLEQIGFDLVKKITARG